MTQKNWQQRNEAYNRERQVMDDWAKKDIELDKMLTEMYKEGAKRIQSRIDGFYMRYAQKEGLTLAEAKKAADMFDVKLWEQDAAKAVADKDFSPYANQWLRLYNLKMKVARDELLKRELELEIAKLTSQVETQMNIARMDAAMKEFERQANILGGSTGTPQRLKSVLNANFYGKSFSERVWGNGGLYHQMQKQVFKSISNIMTDMDGYWKERNRLANVMGAKKHEAMRLLKTEMARIRSDVDLAKYKENGFTHYVFVCEPNPCKICAEYDNQIFEVSKGMTAITMPPLHPNCRCSTYGRVELPDKKISRTEDLISESAESMGVEYRRPASMMRMDLQNLQTFARRDDKKEILAKIANGEIDPDLFYERKREFDRVFKNGVKTPVGKVYNKTDAYYHIINRHAELFTKNGLKEIIKALKTPMEIYETRDRNGAKAFSYFTPVNGLSKKELMVVVRNGIITAYRAEAPYVNRSKAKGVKVYDSKGSI